MVELDVFIDNVYLQTIRGGIFMHGKLNSLDAISYLQNKPKNEIGIEHNIGGIKYIKEIFENINYKITRLDRVFWGGLTKKNLPRKHYRHLSKDEINILKRL